jgi:hypothetical protein
MKFFKCVCTSWSVIPLGGDSLSGHSRIVAGVRRHTTVAICLIVFCIIRTVVRFVLPVPLRPCMTFSTRPGRFAFRRPRRCVFEKVKLRGQLAVLKSLSFFTLGVDMRGPLLILSQSDQLGWIETHAEQLDIAFESLFIEVHPSTGKQMKRFHFCLNRSYGAST